MRSDILISRTKIIGTIGPASADPAVLKEMIRAGLNVVRINCSHGEPEALQKLIDLVVSVSEEMGVAIPLLADLSGPKIRLGDLPENRPVSRGDSVTLTTDPDYRGADKLRAGYPGLADDLNPGHRILIDDGLIQLEVTECRDRDITCLVLNDGILKSRKGINLPGVPISLSSLTEKDRRDIDFLAQTRIDYIALSFVRRREDIAELRTLLREKNCVLPVIAKIEKPEAIEDLEGIIDESDIVMVARGDLGVEIPTEDVPLIQKRIIALCNRENKPVITATQMLDSMISNPRPTRAEASDVANAVFDGTDAVMLSGETSVGDYPVDSVRTMKQIVLKAEQNLSPDKLISLRRREKLETHEASICHAACAMAEQAGAKAMIAITRSGRTARRLSQYRTPIPILAFTEELRTIRYLGIVWGVLGEEMEGISDTDSTLRRARDQAILKGYVRPGDTVVYATGIPLLESNTTNMIKIEQIPEEAGND